MKIQVAPVIPLQHGSLWKVDGTVDPLIQQLFWFFPHHLCRWKEADGEGSIRQDLQPILLTSYLTTTIPLQSPFLVMHSSIKKKKERKNTNGGVETNLHLKEEM